MYLIKWMSRQGVKWYEAFFMRNVAIEGIPCPAFTETPGALNITLRKFFPLFTDVVATHALHFAQKESMGMKISGQLKYP